MFTVICEMWYFNALFLILLISSCREQVDSKQSTPAQNQTTANNTLEWFPKLSEEQLLLLEVEKVKGKINQLIESDSLEKALEAIHYRDQIYRDSIHMTSNLEKSDRSRLSKKMTRFDQMNSELSIKILRKSNWPKTKHMSTKAQEALCLVAIHNNLAELNQLVSENIDRAYHLDSSFSNFMYAAVSDRLSLRAGGDYVYGTLRFKKENFSDQEILQINKNRSKLGLEPLN